MNYNKKIDNETISSDIIESIKTGIPESKAIDMAISDSLKFSLGGSPNLEESSSSSYTSPVGFINDDTAGRTDRLPVVIPGDSYVIPADVVSGLGQGNSMAGASLLDDMFGISSVKRKNGGSLPKEGVDVIVAGGEYVVPPEAVERIGMGDRKNAHRILDSMVKSVRKQVISHLKNLPGPVK